MTWCWHRWSRWKVLWSGRDADFGTPIVAQYKSCGKCGKVKTRMAG